MIWFLGDVHGRFDHVMHWNLDAVKFAKQELEIYWRWFGTFSCLGMYVPVGNGGPNTLPLGCA